MLRKVYGLSAAILFTLAAAGFARAADKPVEIAITFDDMPSHGAVPDGVSRTDVISAVVQAQKAAGAPPMYGFLNANALDTEPSAAPALKLWRDAGNFLGNHTFAHHALASETTAEFIDDATKDEPYLKQYMAGENWHYLRLPYLDMGETQAKRDANHAWLKNNGYRLADVSMGFNDWDYNNAYVRCVKQNNTAKISWLKTHYLIGFAHGLERGRDQAAKVWGHDIKYVYLLHVGVLDSIMFPKVLSLLKAKNVKLIGFPEAISDPVYEKNDLVMTKWGGMLPQRVAEKNNIALPNDPDVPADTLAQICK